MTWGSLQWETKWNERTKKFEKKTFLTHIVQSRVAPLQVEVRPLWQPHTTRRPEQQRWFIGGIGSWRSSLVPLPFSLDQMKNPRIIFDKTLLHNTKIFPFVCLIQVLTCMLQSSSWGKPENWRATNLERTFDIGPPLTLHLYHHHQGIEWWHEKYPPIVILMMFEQLTWRQADPPTKPRDPLVQDCSPAILS